MKIFFTLLLFSLSQNIQAGDKIGEFKTDGREVQVYSAKDPQVQGVVCHAVTTTKMPEPQISQTSISCSQVGPIVIKNIDKGGSGKDAMIAFTKMGQLNELRLRRFYDASTDSLVYVSYIDEIGESKSQHVSIGTIPLNGKAKWITESAKAPAKNQFIK